MTELAWQSPASAVQSSGDVVGVAYATKAYSDGMNDHARVLVFYDARTGAPLWCANAVFDAQATASEQADLLGMGSGRVYIRRVRYDQRPDIALRDRKSAFLDARDARTGKTLWTAPASRHTYSPLSLDAKTGRVFVVGPDRKLRALDAETGRAVWETATPYADSKIDFSIRFVAPNHPQLILDVSSGDQFWIVDRETGAAKMSPPASEYLRQNQHMEEFAPTSLNAYLPKARVFLLDDMIIKGGSYPQVLNAD